MRKDPDSIGIESGSFIALIRSALNSCEQGRVYKSVCVWIRAKVCEQGKSGRVGVWIGHKCVCIKTECVGKQGKETYINPPPKGNNILSKIYDTANQASHDQTL